MNTTKNTEKNTVPNQTSSMEQRIRRFIRMGAWVALAIGTVWSAMRFYDLSQLVIVDAKVQEVHAHPGRCRVPVGKYIDCTQSELVVSFVPRGTSAEQTAEVLIPQRGVTLKSGDGLRVGYSVKTPEQVIIPDVEVFLRAPLGLLLVGIFFAGLERLTR